MNAHKIITSIYLLVLLHVSRGFILLTANIDDMRKLAMKFVPPAMANKIAEVISQTATQVIKDNPLDFDMDLSKENREYNHNSEYRYDFRKDANIFSELEANSKYGPGKYTLNDTIEMYRRAIKSSDDKPKISNDEDQEEENHSELEEKEESGVKSVAKSIEEKMPSDFNNTFSVIHSDNENESELTNAGGDEALARGRTGEVKSDDINSSNDEAINKEKS